MKKVSMLPVLLAALCPIAATSQNATPLVVVAKPVTFARWSKITIDSLERHLFFPRSIRGDDYLNGIVSVSFRCSDDGRPTSVTLVRRSGNRALDAAALHAVGHIATLHPMPIRFRADQAFLANVVFATSQEQLTRQQAVLRTENLVRTARVQGHDEPIALNVSSRNGAGS